MSSKDLDSSVLEDSYDNDQPSLTAQVCNTHAGVASPAVQKKHLCAAQQRDCVQEAGTKRCQNSSDWGPKRSNRQIGRKKKRKLRVTCRLGKGCCRHNSLASHRPAAAETRQEPSFQARMPPEVYPRRSSCRAVDFSTFLRWFL
jgi:hypothetical protein